MRLLPALPLLFLCACVDVPTGSAPAAAVPQPVESPFQGLDPGFKTEETAHFVVKAYSSPTAALYASLCEENYTRIMQDLGLYSFVPARPYNVMVYKDADEFHRKTGQPDWSGGAAYGNALLLFEGQGQGAIIAHEMTHLVFNEFMGLSQASHLRWLNEGAAVYEETRADVADAGIYAGRVAATVADNPIPFSQMVNLAPQTESQKDVDRWYAQVWSVVSFLIRRGGSFNFSIFLTKLRDGADVDRALAETYTGLWSKFSDVETSWKLEVQR
ncbi:MAG: peptidase MA family metallohydrolase [Elusimicrobia bacterium]|nr:peptidase MA family metallohydrolase [Elusimicrobiota bacterium]